MTSSRMMSSLYKWLTLAFVSIVSANVSSAAEIRSNSPIITPVQPKQPVIQRVEPTVKPKPATAPTKPQVSTAPSAKSANQVGATPINMPDIAQPTGGGRKDINLLFQLEKNTGPVNAGVPFLLSGSEPPQNSLL